MRASDAKTTPVTLNWLTDRDRELIQFVYDFRFVSHGQVEKLFFNSSRAARARLNQLINHAYLARLHTIAIDGSGQHHHLPQQGHDVVYLPGRNGLRHVCQVDLQPNAVKNSMASVRESIEAVEFYRYCADLNATDLIFLSAFGPTRLARMLDGDGVAGRLRPRRRMVQPSGLFLFGGVPGPLRGAFLEIGLVSSSPEEMRQRILAYGQVYATWERRPGPLKELTEFPALLIVAESEDQIERIGSALRQQVPDHVHVLLTSWVRIDAQGIAAEVWVDLRGNALSLSGAWGVA